MSIIEIIVRDVEAERKTVRRQSLIGCVFALMAIGSGVVSIAEHTEIEKEIKVLQTSIISAGGMASLRDERIDRLRKKDEIVVYGASMLSVLALTVAAAALTRNIRFIKKNNKK